MTVADENGRDDGLAARDLAPQRRQRIRTIVESRRAARLEELSVALGVSQATVRRDLDELEAEGRVRRVHGGVVAVDERPGEPHFEVKAAEAAEQKERIAARAVALLAPDDTVYLDSGSTVLAAARLLRGWDRLTVVTNSLPAIDRARRTWSAADRRRRRVPRDQPGARRPLVAAPCSRTSTWTGRSSARTPSRSRTG